MTEEEENATEKDLKENKKSFADAKKEFNIEDAMDGFIIK